MRNKRQFVLDIAGPNFVADSNLLWATILLRVASVGATKYQDLPTTHLRFDPALRSRMRWQVEFHYRLRQ
jgi:hypothetical protein